MGAMIFSPDEIAEMVVHFSALTAKIPLRVIRNSAEYDEAVEALNALLDAGVANEIHPLADLVDVLGEFIAAYDDRHYRLLNVTPADVLRELMAQHGILPTDLPEVGSRGAVSEVLAGKRDLTAIQIAEISRRFGVGPTAFIPRESGSAVND